VYFRSRDKDGGHIIRSAIAGNPMLHAMQIARLCILYKRSYCRLKFYTAGIGIFALFLRLRPWPWPDDLRTPWRCNRQTNSELSTTPGLSKVIVLQTYRQTDIIPMYVPMPYVLRQ